MDKSYINSQDYWEARYSSKDWQKKNGCEQTAFFAEEFCRYTAIPSSFDGTLIDIGCALGDSMPILRGKFPYIKLYGADFSQSAIDYCNKRYYDIADFHIANIITFDGYYDIVLLSNVLEHLKGWESIVENIVEHCTYLCIIVPYKEDIQEVLSEHCNSFHEGSFDFLLGTSSRRIKKTIYFSRGFYYKGFLKGILWEGLIKNFFRKALGKKLYNPFHTREILFEIVNNSEV